jgi:hypothetical protein
MKTQVGDTPMTTWMVFIWAALSLLLIALAVEPRTAEAWAAVFCGVLLLLFLGRTLPPP